jgi:hypothetical protein
MMLLLHDPRGQVIRVRANRNRPEDAIRKIWPDANNFWPSYMNGTILFNVNLDDVKVHRAVIEKSFRNEDERN